MQNYRKLGLTSRLKARTGGEETSIKTRDLEDVEGAAHTVSLRLPNSRLAAATESRVEKDPQSGAILRVMPAKIDHRNPLNDPLNDLSDEDVLMDSAALPTIGIFSELEKDAARPSKKWKVQRSLWEEEWAAELVAKYGDDYARMVKDRKLNPYQRTEADIRRRVLRRQRDTPSDREKSD